eukprot:SAG31_NODE_1627_length_7705_cov_5.310939_7_plen_241_part_00
MAARYLERACRVERLDRAASARNVRGVTFSFLCPLSEKCGTFIARCNALIEKVSSFRDAAGFERTAIVATDQGGWPICDVMALNQTVRDAVAVIGSHYPEQGTFQNQGRPFPQAGPTPASCQILNEKFNKSLWTSEGWNLAYVNDWDGGLNLASTINRNYVLQNQTAMVVWNLVGTYRTFCSFVGACRSSISLRQVKYFRRFCSVAETFADLFVVQHLAVRASRPAGSSRWHGTWIDDSG